MSVRAKAAECSDFDTEGGLIAVGVLPCLKEFEQFTESTMDDGIVLYMYALEEHGRIDKYFVDKAEDIVAQMSNAGFNTSTKFFSDDFPVASEMGVASCYNIYTDDNQLCMRIFAVVSGDEVDAKTCAFAARPIIKEWAKDCGLWIPKLSRKPLRMSV